MPRKAQVPGELRRIAVARVRDGQRQVEVAKFLDVSVRSVQRWIRSWEHAGDSALISKSHPGRPSRLSDAQSAEVLSWLSKNPTDFGFVTERWTAPRVAALIRQNMGVIFNHRYLNRWLARRGITPQMPRWVPRERDQAFIDWWVGVKWPLIKKACIGSARPFFSRTRAGF